MDVGSYKVFRYRLENRVDVNAASGWSGSTALVRAISYNRYEMIYALMNAGALARPWPAVGTLYPSSPLESALLHPDPVLVKALLAKGASVKERFPYLQHTPLMRAVSETSAAVVKLLLGAGGSVNDTDKLGYTPLYHALNAEKPQFDIVRLLIDAGADVNYGPKNSLFPLMMASFHGDEHLTRLLLQKGADSNKLYRAQLDGIPFGILEPENAILVDAITGEGITCLMLAAYFGHRGVAEVLLQNAADATIVTNGREGRYTAETLALRAGHKNLSVKIRSHNRR